MSYYQLQKKMESSFDPSDVDASQQLAYLTLKLMARLQDAINTGNSGLRLGRDQKGDMAATIIQAATRLRLLDWNYSAKDVSQLAEALAGEPQAEPQK
jgi:hypothetical protein